MSHIARPTPAIPPQKPSSLGLFWVTIAVGLLVAAPILAVLSSLFMGFGADQAHIWSTRGPIYFTNTLVLCILTGSLAALFGGTTAILVSLFDFPLRRLLSVALVLPFAIPPYLAAYAYGGLLPPTEAQTFRTLSGGALVIAATTYPYVYLAMRASLRTRSASLIEAARSLGAPPVKTIYKIIIPATRAALAGGIILVLMETAADFGVADYFGIPTLSVGIFRTWYGLGSLTGASQLSAGLFFFAMILVVFENATRRGTRAENIKGGKIPEPILLSPIAGLCATAFCIGIFLLGFGIPIGLLTSNADWTYYAKDLSDLQAILFNTGKVAFISALMVGAISILLAYGKRTQSSKLVQIVTRFATLGYALPGAVVAIGILIAGGFFPNALWLTSGIIALTFAYTVRFLAIGFNTTDAGLGQINTRQDEAARNLGASTKAILTKIHLPQLRGTMLAGMLIVMIDVAKELPATLLLRSFNFETLSTEIYRLASDERVSEAAPAAMLLIGFGIIAVALFLNLEGRQRR